MGIAWLSRNGKVSLETKTCRTPTVGPQQRVDRDKQERYALNQGKDNVGHPHKWKDHTGRLAGWIEPKW